MRRSCRIQTRRNSETSDVEEQSADNGPSNSSTKRKVSTPYRSTRSCSRKKEKGVIELISEDEAEGQTHAGDSETVRNSDLFQLVEESDDECTADNKKLISSNIVGDDICASSESAEDNAGGLPETELKMVEIIVPAEIIVDAENIDVAENDLTDAIDTVVDKEKVDVAEDDLTDAILTIDDKEKVAVVENALTDAIVTIVDKEKVAVAENDLTDAIDTVIDKEKVAFVENDLTDAIVTIVEKEKGAVAENDLTDAIDTVIEVAFVENDLTDAIVTIVDKEKVAVAENDLTDAIDTIVDVVGVANKVSVAVLRYNDDNDDDDEPKSTESILGLKRKYTIDRSKYESMAVGDDANNLRQSMSELKKNNIFQDFMKKKRLHCNSTIAKHDEMNLDYLSINNGVVSEKKDKFKLSSSISVETSWRKNNFKHTGEPDKNETNTNVNKLMNKSVLGDDLESRERAPKLFPSKHSIKIQSKQEREETAGKGWYNLPKTELTNKIKNDLQIIKMRNVLDAKHHYKRNDTNKLPKYFQMGTIVEGAHEFYSSRMPKKSRKGTMVEELLADAEFRRKNKAKFLEIRKKQIAGGRIRGRSKGKKNNL